MLRGLRVFQRLGLLVVGLLVLAAFLFSVFNISLFKNTKTLNASALWQDMGCWFDVPPTRTVRCGNLITPAGNKSFTLPVVIFQDQSSDYRDDPLVYINGGPGSSNFLEAESIQHWLDWLDTAVLSRDLIVMDQRGTGLSQPQFRCSAYEGYLRDALAQNLTLQQDAEKLLHTVSQCIEKFQQTGFSFTDFSTPNSGSDLYRLQQVLGYPAWNVMGSSYGTRVAMELARRYPEETRALVLDSVYPPGFGGLMHWPKNLADSFENLWRDCDPKKNCAADFWATVESLNRNPLHIQVSLWDGGWPLDVVVNGHRFLFVTYSALYRSSGPATITKVLEELAAGEITALAKLVEQSVNSDLDPTFNAFTYFMVDCAENYRPTVAEFEAQRRRFPDFESITAQALERDVCQLFPLLEGFESFTRLHKNEIPTLFLSGGLDPATPVRWVEAIQGFYLKGQQWLLPKLSHGVSANSECVLKGIRQFLNAPEVEHPNICAANE